MSFLPAYLSLAPPDHADATADPAQNSNCPPAFARLPDAPQDPIPMGYMYINQPVRLSSCPTTAPPLQPLDMAIAPCSTIPTPADVRSRSVATADTDLAIDKDKKNPCWMCHKAFDRCVSPGFVHLFFYSQYTRPSTLKKVSS
jgi:hypothetical protein